MIRYPFDEVYNLADMNHPLPSTIIQEQIMDGANVYSLAKGTSMSPESFEFYKMLFVKSGELQVIIKDENGVPTMSTLKKSDGIITPKNRIIGVEALEDSVYLEVLLGQVVTETIREPGVVFNVGSIGEYKENSITETYIIKSGFVEVKMSKLAMNCPALEKTTEAAKMLFVYEGSGVVEVGGKQIPITVNDSMRFKPNTYLKVWPKDGNLTLGVTQFFI